MARPHRITDCGPQRFTACCRPAGQRSLPCSDRAGCTGRYALLMAGLFRKADLDVEAAFGLGPRGERRTVGAGDRADDGQAKAVSVAVRGAHAAEPLERLEQAVDLVRQYRRAGVADPLGGLASDLDR